MSVEKTRKVIDDFLSNDAAEVLAIKGGWGAGKTYYWRTVGEPCIDEKAHASFEKYSYVSLFGVDSLDDLKFSVFQNTVDRQSAEMSGKNLSLGMSNGKAKWIKSRWKDLKVLLKKLVKVLDASQIPFISVDIESISFASVRDTVVCLDDMERASCSIDFKDILGLVSSLKEQKNCKVILIFNDEKLSSGRHADNYKELKEKVIDAEISFSPTAKESARLIFGNTNTAPDQFYSYAIDCVVKLDIRNIRTLIKIKKFVNLVLPMLKEFKDAVSLQAVHTLTLLTWSYYSSAHDENIPECQYIKDYNMVNEFKEYLGDAKQNKSPRQKEWSAKLRQYDYNTDEFDLALADVVEKGYADKNTLLPKAKEAHDKVVANDADMSFKAAWDLYHTFDDNEGELVRALREVLVKSARHLLSSQMDLIFTFLVEMGYEDDARRALSKYIKLNEGREGFFDIESDIVIHEYHPEVLNEFRKMNETFKKEKSLEDAVARIAEAGSWGGEEQQIMAQATQDDFYEMFKKLKGSRLRAHVDACLKFREHPIIDNVRSALVKIGRENKLNARRVRGLSGIDVDEQSAD